MKRPYRHVPSRPPRRVCQIGPREHRFLRDLIITTGIIRWPRVSVAAPIRRSAAWWAGMHAERSQRGDDGCLTRVQLVQGRSTTTPCRLPASSATSWQRPAARGTLHALPRDPRIRLLWIIIFPRRSSWCPSSRARILASHEVVKMKTAVALIVPARGGAGRMRARG